MINNSLRLNRILKSENDRICIVPMDHGFTNGPILGLDTYMQTITELERGGADAVILHKGIIKKVLQSGHCFKLNVIMHLSGSAIIDGLDYPKVYVGTVEEGIRLGVDAVSFQLNLGTPYDSQILKDFSNLTKDCQKWNMPLLSMINIALQENLTDNTIHAVRVAEEMGADMVKVYLKTASEIEKVVRYTQLPVFIAGGPKQKDKNTFLKNLSEFSRTGIKGVSIGRNIFQSDDIARIVKEVKSIINNRYKEF